MTRPLHVGVISDTHGLVRAEALAALAGVDHILHAGDVVGEAVLHALVAVAPLTVVRGNNDHGPWADALPEQITVTLGDVAIHVLHDRKDVDLDAFVQRPAVVVTGHSHRPLIERVGGVLFVNPGSAGPRRFSLPVTIARLTIEGGEVVATIVELVVRP